MAKINCTDRCHTDDSQSATNTEPQHTAICYDLIRIDDVNDEQMHADVTNCPDSGLLRETPEGEREKPEGMEQDRTMHDSTANIDKDDNSDILLDDTPQSEEHWSPFQSISGSESIMAQSAEVLVKTAWSIKNLFRREKALPPPGHKHGPLKQ